MIGGFRQPGAPLEADIPGDSDFEVRTHDWCRTHSYNLFQFLVQILFANDMQDATVAQIHATMYDREGRHAAIAFGPFYDTVALYEAFDRINADPRDLGKTLLDLLTKAKEQDEDEADIAT
jgi:hypothetical protein